MIHFGDNVKIIFLDIDGVLCLDGTTFHPDRVQQLKRIVDSVPDCELILSSSWRLSPSLSSAVDINLVDAGIKTCMDLTPDFGDGPRSKEIQAWLDEHPNISKFAIIDDDVDAEIPGHFFRTDFSVMGQGGLTEEIADRIIEFLNS